MRRSLLTPGGGAPPGSMGAPDLTSLGLWGSTFWIAVLTGTGTEATATTTMKTFHFGGTIGNGGITPFACSVLNNTAIVKAIGPTYPSDGVGPHSWSGEMQVEAGDYLGFRAVSTRFDPRYKNITGPKVLVNTNSVAQLSIGASYTFPQITSNTRIPARATSP